LGEESGLPSVLQEQDARAQTILGNGSTDFVYDSDESDEFDEFTNAHDPSKRTRCKHKHLEDWRAEELNVF